MEKMSQISETHPILERREGVKKYRGNEPIGYPLLEVVLTLGWRRGEEAPPRKN